MLAGFVSDVFYLGASWRLYHMVGAERLFWLPWLWGKNEWTTLAASWVPFLQRIAFLAGIGIKESRVTNKTGPKVQ